MPDSRHGLVYEAAASTRHTTLPRRSRSHVSSPAALSHLRNHRSVHEPAVANMAASFTHTARSSPRHTRHMRRLRQRRTRTTGDHDSLLSSLSAVSHFWTRSDLCSYADSSCTSSPHSRCSGVVHTYTLVSTPPPPHHTHHMHIARAHCRNTAVAPRLV